MTTPTDEATNLFGRSFAMATQSSGVDNSADITSPTTPLGIRPKEKKRVGFSGTPSAVQSGAVSPGGSGASTPGRLNSISLDVIQDDRSHLPQLSLQDTEQIKQAFSDNIARQTRPAIKQVPATQHAVDSEDENESRNSEKAYRRRKAREALQRGIDLERDERIRSAPTSRQVSPMSGRRRTSRPSKDNDVAVVDDHDSDSWLTPDERDSTPPDEKSSVPPSPGIIGHQSGFRSGVATPMEEINAYEEYTPRPKKYRGGILSALLRLGEHSHRGLPPDVGLATTMYSGGKASSSDLPGVSHLPHVGLANPDSGASTPRRRGSWYSSGRSNSTASLSQLIRNSVSLSAPVAGLGEVSRSFDAQQKPKRPQLKERVRSSGTFQAIGRHIRTKPDDRLRIHIAEIVERQNYLIQLCKALMSYGAPSHRMEEYMKMSSRVLEIEAQFLYIPGAMLMSFDDHQTNTTSLKLVRVPQGLNLGKLRDVHEIYKDVVHDRVSVTKAMHSLNKTFNKQPRHGWKVVVLAYGIASLCVAPFAFGARPIDLPMAFLLGLIVGVLQLCTSKLGQLYTNVFEIGAATITSFLARGLGSIRYGDSRLFCFSALAQSSIALILPGYFVLLASLELQSKSIVAGSVRMVYAIIYSLFLGYGITLGTALYATADKDATSATTCEGSTPRHTYILFVFGFTVCLIVINQAKWKQAPMMVLISLVGYTVNYFSAQKFSGNVQISNMLGALAIGGMANLWSRLGHKVENFALDVWEDRLRKYWQRIGQGITSNSKKMSPKKLEAGLKGNDESSFTRMPRKVGYSLAAAAMLPAIWVQVPSGIAVGGSLLTGLASANQITNSSLTNGTQTTNLTSIDTASTTLNTVSFNVAYSMVQVAIGITVGLSMSAIFIYPFGKQKSALFSF